MSSSLRDRVGACGFGLLDDVVLVECPGGTFTQRLHKHIHWVRNNPRRLSQYYLQLFDLYVTTSMWRVFHMPGLGFVNISLRSFAGASTCVVHLTCCFRLVLVLVAVYISLRFIIIEPSPQPHRPTSSYPPSTNLTYLNHSNSTTFDWRPSNAHHTILKPTDCDRKTTQTQ